MGGIGRNQKCPCGSGKKFKNCHGNQQKLLVDEVKDKAIRNPDGSVNMMFSLPFDEFGPPFGFKELVTVPRYDEKYYTEEQQPTPEGKPGEYEIKFVFARPEISLTLLNDTDSILLNGDSTIVFTQPAPRKKSDPTSIKLELEINSKDNQLKRSTFIFKSNIYGRIASVETTLVAEGYRQARNIAYTAILPVLSNWSFQHNTPFEIKTTITTEKDSGGQNTELRIPFPFQTINLHSEELLTQEHLALLSFYREGMNSNSINYSFLCFFRILEAIYKNRNVTAQQKKIRYEYTRDNTLSIQDLAGLPRHMERYNEFVGKKFRNIFDNDLNPLRIKIAHGLLGDENPFENTPDDVNLRNRASYLIPITQIIARIEIKNELTKRLVQQTTKLS